MAAVIEAASGRVVNIVTADPDWQPGDGLWLGPDGGAIGDTWDGSQYIKPAEPDRDLEDARADYLSQIDATAESVRQRYITPGFGMALTYQEKFTEAEGVHELGETAANAMAEADRVAAFPILSASVGIEADTLWQCAQGVIKAYQQFAVLGGKIEAVRLAAKKQMKTAVSLDAMQSIMDGLTWPT